MVRATNYLILLFVLSSCGVGPGADLKPVTSTNPAPEGSTVNFSFQFSSQLDATNNDLDSTLVYPDTYTVPLSITESGEVTLLAKDFPQLIFRICSAGSTAAQCHLRLDGDLPIDGTNTQEAADIVIDACGQGITDANCGLKDSTVFTGKMNADGSMDINGVGIRVRVFLVKTNSDGFRAEDEDTGLLPLERISVRVTTGSVTTGNLSGTGSPISNRQITLVAGGLVPSSYPEVGGSNFISKLTGEFDIDPLALLK